MFVVGRRAAVTFPHQVNGPDDFIRTP